MAAYAITASTPGSACNAFSTCSTQLAQVMPVTGKVRLTWGMGQRSGARRWLVLQEDGEGLHQDYPPLNSPASISACRSTSSVASFCMSGG